MTVSVAPHPCQHLISSAFSVALRKRKKKEKTLQDLSPSSGDSGDISKARNTLERKKQNKTQQAPFFITCDKLINSSNEEFSFIEKVQKSNY